MMKHKSIRVNYGKNPLIRAFTIVAAISLATLFLLLLCGCDPQNADESDASSSKPTALTHNNASNSISSESKSSTTAPTTSSTAKSITTYEELIDAGVGTKVTVEGVSTESAFDRAWSGTHYKFTMTFGDSDNDKIYIDMSIDKKSQNIVRGTRVSVTGEVTGLKGASGGCEVPEIGLESYKVLS